MISPSTQTATEPTAAYWPPTLTVLGSVESITLSSRSGSISDFKGRTSRH